MSEVHKKIEEFVKKHKVVLFMKGTPSMPQCGFSAATVECLNAAGADYQSIDVLADPDVRDGIKSYANWPTIPQLYINGEFVGGCDIVKDMHNSGDLSKALA